MGEVVGAAILAHVPTIMLPEAVRYDLNDGKEISLVPGLKRLRKEIFETLDYDTVVVLDSHWATTVEFVVTSHAERSGLFTSEELPRGMSQIPYFFKGNPELANSMTKYDEKNGTWITPNQVLALALYHLKKNRGWTGAVVRTVPTSHQVDAVAELLGVQVHETPVGFKYIAAEMLSGEVLVGGEESGGVGFGMHLPERDAPFAALLLIEALVEGGLPLGERIDALQQRCGGAAAYDRLDLRLPDMECRRRLEATLAATPPREVAGGPVLDVITTDGAKLRLGPSHWLMLRFSGTEPLLRLYCEAPNEARVQEVLSWARALAEGS